jgi:hypothetical protein
MSGDESQENVQSLEAAGFSPHRWQKLAETMDKDDGTAIFRRFGDLNMLNLLGLQAELLKLRSDFRELCAHVPSDNKNAIQGYIAAYSLPSGQQAQEAEDVIAKKARERLELHVKIREKLKEYSELGWFLAMVLSSSMKCYAYGCDEGEADFLQIVLY